MTIAPEAYTAWRVAPLGVVTEAIEHRLILDMMGVLAGARVLDVGCGDGALVCAAASRGADVTGIDPAPAMLAAARSRVAKAGVCARLLAGRVERLPFPDASFDVVASVTVLCFVPDAAVAVREMARVLRPGGRLVLGELGRWSLWAAIRRLRGWLGSSTWKAARFRTATELQSLAEQAGLSVTTIRGSVYYPPVGQLARALAPIDSLLGGLTTFGAAFIALSAVSAGDSSGAMSLGGGSHSAGPPGVWRGQGHHDRGRARVPRTTQRNDPIAGFKREPVCTIGMDEAP